MKVRTQSSKKQSSLETAKDFQKDPTGKYAIPKLSFSLQDIIDYFSPYGSININEDNTNYLIYFEGRYMLPKPNVLFLDNNLLSNYQLATTQYWNFIESSDKVFRENCESGNDVIKLEKLNGITNYMLKHEMNNLPKGSDIEAFRLKVSRANRRNVSITIKRKDYHDYIRSLTYSFTSDNFPIIASTIILENNLIRIDLLCSANALNCITYSTTYLCFELKK